MTIRGVDDDLAILLERIKSGEGVLILGAGVNYGSTDRRGRPIFDGKEFAKYLTEKIPYEYHDEPLSEVVGAFKHKIGKETFHRYLQESFTECLPSKEIKSLFKFTFRRIYSWNVDDVPVKGARGGVQTLKFYNGMIDKVEESSTLDRLQFIHLHGNAREPENGFIFSDQDYSKALSTGGHAWYRQLVDDYRAYCPIFIGSKLNEPILAAELDRAAEEHGGESGQAYLITPEKLSPIRSDALAARGIVHLSFSFGEFVQKLTEEMPSYWSPREVSSQILPFDFDESTNFSSAELSSAQSLRPIKLQSLRESNARLSRGQMAIEARKFLQGFPPNWNICASSIPIVLASAKNLQSNIMKSIDSKIPLHVTVGAAGSGKSTAVMQALLRIVESEDFELFELDENFESMSDVVSVLSKISSKPKIVYIPSLYAISNIIIDHLQKAVSNNIFFVSTARSSEWGSYISIVLGDRSSQFRLDRFGQEDYKPLIEKLLKYVPAPKFNQMSDADRFDKFRKSKSQLLIALREATESKNFDVIIADEFENVVEPTIRFAFAVIGLATLARVGVRASNIKEAIGFGQNTDLNQILESLDGIVLSDASNRKIARHDFYVRKVFEVCLDAETVIEAIIALLGTFTKYQNPIARNVNRKDAILFRYLFNHDSLNELGKLWGERNIGAEIYNKFEVEFQLDGHFWLQYGLFLSDLGETEQALEKLDKSIQAFPGNLFAQHALASMQLRYAKERAFFDKQTIDLIDEAVGILNELDANPQLRVDQFPILTLAVRHVEVLRKHGKETDALKFAKLYFSEVQRKEQLSSNSILTLTKEFLLKYITLGVWEPPAVFSRRKSLAF